MDLLQIYKMQYVIIEINKLSMFYFIHICELDLITKYSESESDYNKKYNKQNKENR